MTAHHVSPQPAATHEDAELLKDTERARLRALVAGDHAAALALHAPDFQLITPIGARLNREEYLGAIAVGQIDYEVWEPGPMQLRLSGDTALLRYRAQLQVVFGGHRVQLSEYWHTDSYERSEGRWQAVWSQATQIVGPAA